MDAAAAAKPHHAAILLCAGYGTRMGALVEETPKPLLKVGGRPVLDYLLDQIAALDGIGDVYVVASSRYAAAFERWAEGERGRRGGMTLSVFDNGTRTNEERLGAIGDLGFVLGRAGVPDAALVAAGDNVLRFSLAPLWRRFRENAVPWGGERGGNTVHQVLALKETRRERLQKTGVLELDGDGRVLALHEKPAEPPSTFFCPPFYCLGRSALLRVAPYLEAGEPGDEIGRFLGHLVRREAVHAVAVDGGRLDIGSPQSYREADEILRREPVIPEPT